MEASLRNRPTIDIDNRLTGARDLRSKIASAKWKDEVADIAIRPGSNDHGFLEGDLSLGAHGYSVCVLLTTAVSISAPIPST